MERYELTIKASAAGELEKLRFRDDRRRIVKRIGQLADSPRPRGCEKLSGRTDLYRVRQGDFRIVYAVDDENRRVRIVKIGQRREVYR